MRRNINSVCLAAMMATLCTSHARAGQCENWISGPLLAQSEGINGIVECQMIWTPPGGSPLLVVGGSFTTAGGSAANDIAAWDGASWRALGGGADAAVWCLGVFNGELIAGGEFTSAGGVAASHIARFNGTTWQPLGAGLGGSAVVQFPTCRALTTYNGELIAGGTFATAGGVTCNHVARWNGSTWSALAGPAAVGVSGPVPENVDVRALTVLNNLLYIGGEFQTAASIPVLNIASWDGSAGLNGWHSLGGTGKGVNNLVHALSQFSGELTVGGEFTQALNAGGAVSSPGVARWNPTTSTWAAFGSGVSGTAVYALQNFNGGILAGGWSFNGGPNLAFWNGSTWSLFNGGVAGPDSPFFHQVATLSIFNGNVIVGGWFTSVGGGSASTTNIAQWNGTQWTSFGGGTAASVNALATLGSRVIIGGDFDQACTNTPDRAIEIAAWNGTALEPLGTGMNNAVLALKSYSIDANTTELVAGGHFNAAGNLGAGSANRIARWQEGPGSLPIWLPMGTGFNSAVFALERVPGNQVLSDTTYAGGAFTASGDSTATFLHIAAWGGSPLAWTPLGAGLNNTVRAIKGFNTGGVTQQVIAGGDFTASGSVSVNHIAVWPIFNLNGWQPMGAGFDNTVYAIERFNNVVYAAGSFTLSGPTPLNRIAKWNGSAWVAVGNGGANGGFNDTVYTLRIVGSNLYAGGDFTQVDGIATNRIAKLDGATGAWSAVPGGPDGAIFSLTLYQTEIVAGGSFNTVGSPPQVSARLGRFSESGVPWIMAQPIGQTVGCGGTASFTVQPASGYPGLSYQWRKDTVALSNGPSGHGSTVSGVNAATLVISGSSNSDDGNYDCIVTASGGCGSLTSGPAALSLAPACCTPDINHDGIVNVNDLLVVINGWGSCPAPPTTCTADIAPSGGDGVVNVIDLLAVINGWGACP